jgi:hypothetical protein
MLLSLREKHWARGCLNFPAARKGTMHTKSIELGQSMVNIGRVEFALNGAQILEEPIPLTTFKYERDQDDFEGSAPGDFWGTAGELRTPTKDSLTPLGRVVIHALRSSPDITKIFIPLGGKRIYAYTTKRTMMENKELPRLLLNSVQNAAASNPEYAFDEASNGGIAAKARDRVGAAASALRG